MNRDIFSVYEPLCGTWCAILGLGGPFFPTCRLKRNHDGDHLLEITIGGENTISPHQGKFTITWTQTEKAQDI